MTRERRLGRGLEALLGRADAASGTEAKPDSPEAEKPKEAATEPARAEATTSEPPPAERPKIGIAAHTVDVSQIPPAPPVRPVGNAPARKPEAETYGVEGAATAKSEPEGERILQLPVFEVDSNPYQPRKEFSSAELSSLADSLIEHGMLQPVVVRPHEGRYQLVSGERRLRAAMQAGWTEVPARVQEVSDRQMAEMAIVENMQRKDLGPLEKAASFQQYLETYGATQEELAGRLKIDRSTIANLIRLLELPQAVRESLKRRKITQGHARALLPLGVEREQIAFCARIQKEGLSVRQTEALVTEQIESADADLLEKIDTSVLDAPLSRRKPKTSNLAALEQELKSALGTKVDVRQTAKGKGKIVVHFKSHEEFERLRSFLTGEKGAGQKAG